MDRLRTALALFLALPLAQQKPSGPEKPKVQSVQEHVKVERVVITGRVIDRFANPIPNLTARDFRLRVDGQRTPIESVEWIPGEARPSRTAVETSMEDFGSELPPKIPAPADQPASAAPPRMIVMLFQWEIAGQKDTGFVRMMRQAERFVDSADPADRFALLGYGSSLKLLQDFTTDHAAVRDAIEAIRSLSFRGRTANANGSALSAAVAGCGPTGSIQKAIICIGDSLQAFPGSKTLLFFGWTVGRRWGPERLDYPKMVEAIGRAQTSVRVLDVSDGRHTLAEGIARLAYDTGGLYNGGCLYEMRWCADLARLRVHSAVEGGTYEAVFRDPVSARGWHKVEIELVGRPGTALFPRWYRD